MDGAEESITRLFLFQRTLTSGPPMISLDCYFPGPFGNTTTTSGGTCAPTSPLSKLAIDWTVESITLNLLHPLIFWGAFNSSMIHLCKTKFLFCVQAATASDAAAIDLFPRRHDAVNWAWIFVAWHLSVQIGRAFFASE
jgi:hypothetical protein